MRKLALAAALLLVAATASAHDVFSINGDSCQANNFHWDGGYASVAKETIDARSLRSLKATVAQAPIAVVGDSPAGYSIEVCKVAARAEDLASIRVSLSGNELVANGPDDARWAVHYKIHAPRNADLQLEAKNGPLALRDVDGTVVARTKNGPLALENVSGNVTATANNGPISIHGGSGTMKIEATNGPLSVSLDGRSWQGSLDASTKNGPLSVKVPRDFATGVVVEALGRGPISCNAAACGSRSRTFQRGSWDDEDEAPRTIELGNGPANVHLSTVNGPVTVKDF